MKKRLEFENICKTYSLGEVLIPALRDVNLSIAEGEFVAISGPSGSGKTTLLNLIGLIDKPTSGTIRFEENIISYNGSSKLHRLRQARIGFIFQSFNLIPVLNAFENVEYPLLLTTVSAQQRKKRVEEMLDEVGLLSLRAHKPRELSGGQRQRVAIARALVHQPKIVLADEPSANLDTQTAQDILQLMEKLNREENVSFIFSTHDPQIVKIAKRVVNIRDGRISN